MASINGSEGGKLITDSVWPYGGFALTPDGEWLAYARGEKGPLVIMDLQKGERIAIEEKALPYEGLQWSPDGSRLTGKRGLAGLVLVEREGMAFRVSERGIPGDQSWAPDGQRFLIIQEKGLAIYDLKTHQLHSLPIELHPPYAAAWNPK